MEAVGRDGHAVKAVRIKRVGTRLIDLPPAAVHGLSACGAAPLGVEPRACGDRFVASWTGHNVPPVSQRETDACKAMCKEFGWMQSPTRVAGAKPWLA